MSTFIRTTAIGIGVIVGMAVGVARMIRSIDYEAFEQSILDEWDSWRVA